jgi:hypothetical protein
MYDVEILNIFKFECKDMPGVYKCGLSYRLLDNKSICSTAKMKGFANLAFYIDDVTFFDKFDPKYFGTNLKVEVIEEPSPTNPMRKRAVLKAIRKANGEDLYLL